jgi:hypothetical protein
MKMIFFSMYHMKMSDHRDDFSLIYDENNKFILNSFSSFNTYSNIEHLLSCPIQETRIKIYDKDFKGSINDKLNKLKERTIGDKNEQPLLPCVNEMVIMAENYHIIRISDGCTWSINVDDIYEDIKDHMTVYDVSIDTDTNINTNS